MCCCIQPAQSCAAPEVNSIKTPLNHHNVLQPTTRVAIMLDRATGRGRRRRRRHQRHADRDQHHHRSEQSSQSAKIAQIVHKQVTSKRMYVYSLCIHCMCLCRREREVMMMFTSIIITCARFIRDNPNAIALRDGCTRHRRAERVLRHRDTPQDIHLESASFCTKCEFYVQSVHV